MSDINDILWLKKQTFQWKIELRTQSGDVPEPKIIH